MDVTYEYRPLQFVYAAISEPERTKIQFVFTKVVIEHFVSISTCLAG